MPLLQYRCPECGKEFDELVKNFSDETRCPECEAVANRLYCGKMFSSTGKPAKKCGGNCKTCNGCK